MTKSLCATGAVADENDHVRAKPEYNERRALNLFFAEAEL